MSEYPVYGPDHKYTKLNRNWHYIIRRLSLFYAYADEVRLFTEMSSFLSKYKVISSCRYLCLSTLFNKARAFQS